MTTVNKDTLGKLFVDERGRFWQHITYTDQPTVMLKQVGSSEYFNGVVGAPNMDGFREPIREELEARIRDLEDMVTTLMAGKS